MKCCNSSFGRGVCDNGPFGVSDFWVIWCKFDSCMYKFSLVTSSTGAGHGGVGTREVRSSTANLPSLHRTGS